MNQYKFRTQQLTLQLMARYRDRAMRSQDIAALILAGIGRNFDRADLAVVEKRVTAAVTVLHRRGLIEREEPGWYAVTLAGLEVAR